VHLSKKKTEQPTKKRLGTKELGQRGEEIASALLKEKGITPVFHNWKCSFGEIDIIAKENDELVFVEVKTRYHTAFSEKHLLDAVSHKKKKKLQSLAQIFMKRYYPNNNKQKYRIDIVGLLLHSDNSLKEMRHLKGAL